METILFKDLKVSKEILKAVGEMGFEEATPIQSMSIMPILEGRDIVAQAPTGTGKTCAFGIPLIERAEAGETAVGSLVLCPTRELAIQITDELLKLAKHKRGIKIVPVYGGQPIDRQIQALKRKPQIIVATPGRLMDHMRRRTIRLQQLKYVVLDEADEMLNMGFREDIDTILESVPEERQMVLFSATLSKEIMQITKKYQKDPQTIKVAHKEVTVPTIRQYYVEVRADRKIDALTRLIDAQGYKLSIVFCNTKRMVDELAESLTARGYLAGALHGDMKQVQRDRVMNNFKRGKLDILVATDVAARGIDVDDVEAVFNYDIPEDEEYYVHRIGRTGRANKEGASYTFATHRQLQKLRDIMKYTKSTIIPYKLPRLSEVEGAKLSKIFAETKEYMKKDNHDQYVTMLQKYMEEDESELTTLDLAAALLNRYTNILTAKPEENNDTLYEPVRSEGKRSREKKGCARLFFNIGRLDKVNRRSLLELFRQYTAMDPELVQEADVLDKYSFVNVPEEWVQEVLDTMNGVEYRGRVLHVEQANKKSAAVKRVPGRRPAPGGRTSRRREPQIKEGKGFYME